YKDSEYLPQPEIQGAILQYLAEVKCFLAAEIERSAKEVKSEIQALCPPECRMDHVVTAPNKAAT
ncbi:Hypothetical predicted protein, partial [Pelobates cultripes]